MLRWSTCMRSRSPVLHSSPGPRARRLVSHRAQPEYWLRCGRTPVGRADSATLRWRATAFRRRPAVLRREQASPLQPRRLREPPGHPQGRCRRNATHGSLVNVCQQQRPSALELTLQIRHPRQAVQATRDRPTISKRSAFALAKLSRSSGRRARTRPEIRATMPRLRSALERVIASPSSRLRPRLSSSTLAARSRFPAEPQVQPKFPARPWLPSSKVRIWHVSTSAESRSTASGRREPCWSSTRVGSLISE